MIWFTGKIDLKMREYSELLDCVITRQSIKSSIKEKLSAIAVSPSIYLAENERGAESSDDYLWLALVDELLFYGYCFEIDWKEFYDVAKDGVFSLLANWGESLTIVDDDDLYDMDAEEFFPLLNGMIKKSTAFVLCNLDIDSDSYVSVLVPSDHLSRFLSLDDRIREYL